MLTEMQDRVKNTRTMLRRQMIETILDEFDDQCMHLNYVMRKEKYEKMKESPFRFFRGSAYLFYYDMMRIPFSFHTPEDKPVWIQGDLHMENFGAFQNEKGEIVFDVNDFDEGYIGSYLYDVLRMSVSIALFCDAQRLSEKEQKERILAFLQGYYEQLKRFKKKKDDPFKLNFTSENTKGPVQKVLKKLEKRQKDHLLKDITYINEENKRVFAWSDEIQPVSPEERKALESFSEVYFSSLDAEDKRDMSFYAVKDMARKHGSGTASIGLDRFYILVEGGKEAHGVDDLVLEVKEVRIPIPSYFLPYSESFWEKYSHQGKRVITTQKAMHHLEDPYLGYLTIDDRDFYVRERSPYKRKVKAKDMKKIKDIDETLELMGKITAKIHARADVDVQEELFSYHSEEEILKAIGDQFDSFCTQIVLTAMTYKVQVIRDYELFCQWADKEFSAEKEVEKAAGEMKPAAREDILLEIEAGIAAEDSSVTEMQSSVQAAAPSVVEH